MCKVYMGRLDKYFVEVKHGAKVTYSESDLSKLDRMYETEVFNRKEKKIMSPFRKEMQRSFQSQVRDYAFERILDQHLYTFSHLLVIPDPYGQAKQTALLLFNSSKESKIRYRVKGDMPEYDFVGESEITTRHRVAIMGLYAGRNNQIDLQLIDAEGNLLKHRELIIYVSAVQENISDLVGKVDKQMSHFPFILLNGVGYSPVAIDGQGQIRYSMQCKTGKLGMIPLANGRFLLMDKTANRVNQFGKVQPCRYHEIDYLGRVYRTFLLEHQIGRAIAQNDNSLFFVTSSDAGHVSDMLVELNMETGDIVKSCSLADVVGDKYKDCENWADITYMEYQDGKLLITVKRLNTVMMLEWSDLSVKWILAPQIVWQDTAVQKLVLSSADSSDTEPICSCPEYTSYEGTDEESHIRLLMFDTQNVIKVPSGLDGPKKSLAKTLVIDEEHGTYSVVEGTRLLRSPRYGRALRSNDGKHLLAAEGFLKKQIPVRHAQLVEIDAVTGKIQKTTCITKAFLSAWEFAPDISEYCVSMEKNDNIIFGSLKDPEKFTGKLPEISTEKINNYCFGRGKICDNLFLFSMRAGTIDRIYFIGDNNAYVQNYEDIDFKDKKEFFAIPLDNFVKDEYHVYVECQGEAFKLKNEIRVVK